VAHPPERERLCSLFPFLSSGSEELAEAVGADTVVVDEREAGILNGYQEQSEEMATMDLIWSQMARDFWQTIEEPPAELLVRTYGNERGNGKETKRQTRPSSLSCLSKTD
jgi:hypothetical protein